MRTHRVAALSVFVAAGTLLVGCTPTADFPIAVGNRIRNPVEANVNGVTVGIVPPGEDRQFFVEVRTLESGGYYYNTPRVAYVTVTARDTRTQKLSRPFYGTAYTDRVLYIAVNEWDFLP